MTALCTCLNDKDVLVRRDAAGALGSLGKAGAAGAEALLQLVKVETDDVVKKTAIDALGHLAGPEHRPYAQALQPLLENKDPELAMSAALVLARIGGEEGASALPVLRKGLKDPDAHVQEMAAAALSNLGPKAEPAMYDLAEVLTNGRNSTFVRRYAALALSHIGPAAKPVVPSIVQALRPAEPVKVRQYAAEVLAQMKYPANEKAVPAILETIEKDTDPVVRQKCVWSLFRMNNVEEFKRSGAEKTLTKVLDDQSEKMTLVRYDAARKLAYMLGADAPDKTVDVLLNMLNNKRLNVYNRTDAKVEGTGNEATAGRANVKENLGGDARYMAVEALGWLGPTKVKARDDVVKALKQAARDEDATLRAAAKKALTELGIE